MTGRLFLWLLLTLAAIGLDFKARRDPKKSLTALATFVWILSVAAAGLTMRAVLPFFVPHLLLIAAAWAALLYYLWRGRYLWWVFLLPLGTLGLFVLFDFMEGARYH